MTKKCFYCGDALGDAHFRMGTAVWIGINRYAHCDCIDSHGKESTMNDQTQHILGAADSAHQGIELARSLIQESLGNMGEILTQGCTILGPASLGSAMRLGQQLKELNSLLAGLLSNAHGLCVLLGKDLGVCEDKVVVLDPGPECPSDTSRYYRDMFGDGIPDSLEQQLPYGDGSSPMDVLDSEDLGPGEDEYDDDEQPF